MGGSWPARDEMDDMVKIQAGRGIMIDDNDFILDPQWMLPPPRIRGDVTSVRVEGDDIVQVFGTGPAPGRRLLPYASYPNYMYFRGGNLRFGKLTMADTDLALIDQDPKDPFDFNLERYNVQLVAGIPRTRRTRRPHARRRRHEGEDGLDPSDASQIPSKRASQVAPPVPGSMASRTEPGFAGRLTAAA